MDEARLAELDEMIAECCGRRGFVTDAGYPRFCESFDCATVRDLTAEVRRLRAGLAACREVLETCDWTGPYAELNAARTACGLPEL